MTLLCPQCFGNSGLRRRIEQIRPDYDEGRCVFHKTRKGTPIDAVGAIIDEVFRSNYAIAGSDTYYSDDLEDPETYDEQRGEDLRQTVGDLTEPTVPDVQDLIADWLMANDNYWPPDGEEPFYLDEYRYERTAPGDAGHAVAWSMFRESIMHEQRFFNRSADDWLASIFQFIHLQRDEARLPPVYLMDPDQAPTFFRARVADVVGQRKILANPLQEMGAPPRRLGKPNRMNPSGITALYASLDIETCLSELRPLVGAEVVTAELKLHRPIVVLDTTRFQAPPKELNLFARDHARRLTQWRFMQRFMNEISKPILPSDEHLDYVPTQAVSEYLHKVHEVRIGKAARKIDAIIFKSAQRPSGTNIVLFGDAAAIMGANDGASKTTKSRSSPSLFDLAQPQAPTPGLALDPTSLTVRQIREAQFPASEPVDLDFAVNPAF